jgi:hypothetical protein
MAAIGPARVKTRPREMPVEYFSPNSRETADQKRIACLRVSQRRILQRLASSTGKSAE